MGRPGDLRGATFGREFQSYEQALVVVMRDKMPGSLLEISLHSDREYVKVLDLMPFHVGPRPDLGCWTAELRDEHNHELM